MHASHAPSLLEEYVVVHTHTHTKTTRSMQCEKAFGLLVGSFSYDVYDVIVTHLILKNLSFDFCGFLYTKFLQCLEVNL